MSTLASEPASSCPDRDGDGFPDALACPWRSPLELDCDDSDAAVTPATERWVPPGPFLMGSASSHAGRDERPVHVVQLSGFCLDLVEVETEAWSRWLRAEGRTPQGSDLRGLDDDLRPAAGRERHPAEGVTWAEARDYCEAQGKALPTEAQWEKAARGGCELGDDPGRCDPADLRPYPWGSSAPSCELANHQDTTRGRPQLCHSDTLPSRSGEAGAGPYGHLHLAGNVWEYVADSYHPTVYASAVPRRDPGGPAGGGFHVLRGGSWNTFSTNMRVANRFHDLVMGSATGIRCARPTVDVAPDVVEALQLATVVGTVEADSGVIEGRSLYVTAFDAEDVDPVSGMLTPGRSPVAELRLEPAGMRRQPFALEVPVGAAYILSAALDSGTGARKDGYMSASGSGGFGSARQNPVRVDGEVDGIEITIIRHTGPGGGSPPHPPPKSHISTVSPPGASAPAR